MRSGVSKQASRRPHCSPWIPAAQPDDAPFLLSMIERTLVSELENRSSKSGILYRCTDYLLTTPYSHQSSARRKFTPTSLACAMAGHYVQVGSVIATRAKGVGNEGPLAPGGSTIDFINVRNRQYLAPSDMSDGHQWHRNTVS